MMKGLLQLGEIICGKDGLQDFGIIGEQAT